MPKNFSVTQASLTSVFIYVVGQIAAVVPSISNQQQSLISHGSLVIAAVFAIVHLVDNVVGKKTGVTLAELETGIRNFADDEISKTNFVGIANDVISAHGLSNIEARVKAELNKILLEAGLEKIAPVPAPVVDPTPVVVDPAAVPPVV